MVMSYTHTHTDIYIYIYTSYDVVLIYFFFFCKKIYKIGINQLFWRLSTLWRVTLKVMLKNKPGICWKHEWNFNHFGSNLVQSWFTVMNFGLL